MSSAKDEVLLLFGGTWSERSLSRVLLRFGPIWLPVSVFARFVDDAYWVTLDSEDLEAAESHTNPGNYWTNIPPMGSRLANCLTVALVKTVPFLPGWTCSSWPTPAQEW